ncbi:MAG: hypothetical protein SP4CHLAM17_09620 [Chlamydiales bacterium]|nr:hypothetical protein [Chlamydiales bacterium]
MDVNYFLEMFSARFERATYRLGGDRSILLSYENVLKRLKKAEKKF